MGIPTYGSASSPGMDGPAISYLPVDRSFLDRVIIWISYILSPLGLLLALMRMATGHYRNYRRGSGYSLIAHALFGMFMWLSLLLIVNSFTGKHTMLFFGVMLTLYAVLFLLPAWLMARAAEKAQWQFSRLAVIYKVRVIDERILSVDTIAERTGQHRNDVWKDLLYLQDTGFLPEHLIFHEGAHDPAFVPKPEQAVQCGGCGATNAVRPGDTKACEYCGTIITGPA